MKINVLILVTEAIGGGVERLIYDQMRFYDKKRINLHVITIRKGYLEKEFSETSANYMCLDVNRKVSYKVLKKLVCYIRSNHIDIIHTHLYLPDIYGFLAKMIVPRVKLFTTKHNTNQFRKKLFWGILDKILSLPAARIIAVSEAVKKFIAKYEYISPHRISVIYHGIDISRFTKNVNTGNIRNQLRISKNSFVIGIVGRITEQKGHVYLLQAIVELKVKIPGIKLLVIGTGELLQELSDYCNKLNIKKQVIFLGFRKDVPQLYRIMDVLCLPSIYEGLGLVLVEAMLCNTITVGSKIHGIEEIINDGINGFLVPPRDSEALTKVLYKIYKLDYNHNMRRRAKQTAYKFDYRKNLKKIEKTYFDVLRS